MLLQMLILRHRRREALLMKGGRRDRGGKRSVRWGESGNGARGVKTVSRV